MKIIELIKSELQNFGRYEKTLFPLVIIMITCISIMLKDNKIALVSAICGISYTILAGKGKISCFFIGIIGTFCYSYLSFVNGFYGNLMLYALYYLPMEITGIFEWQKHLKKEVREIKKTKLNKKDRFIYFGTTFVVSILFSIVLKITGDSKPFMDALTTVFSLLGQLLTVKRCIEQWYVWFFVNLLSLIMWIYAYINGSNCFATILMWGIYTVLAVYFLLVWQREIENR